MHALTQHIGVSNGEGLMGESGLALLNVIYVGNAVHGHVDVTTLQNCLCILTYRVCTVTEAADDETGGSCRGRRPPLPRTTWSLKVE